MDPQMNVPLMIIACPRCQLRYDATGRQAGSSLDCRCGNRLEIPGATATARSLQCPNCGGPVPLNNSHCQFCETSLAVLNCPGCFTLQFLGTRFCSDCGTELNKPARAETQNDLDCPRCQSPLTTRQYSYGAVDHCKQCGGLWLDHVIFEKTVHHNRAKADVSLQTTKPGNHTVFNNFPVNYLPCPECHSLMHRRNFAQRSGVIVDVCTSHGVWLDHKELSAILNFIRDGGMKTPHAQAAAPLAPVDMRTHRSPLGVHTTLHTDDGLTRTLGWSDIVDLLRSLPFSR